MFIISTKMNLIYIKQKKLKIPGTSGKVDTITKEYGDNSYDDNNNMSVEWD